MRRSDLEGLLYDWESALTLQRQNLDVSFYLSLLRERGCPDGGVLVMGCGTGRVALPLAQAGYQVAGIDLSRARLRVARGRTPTGMPVRWRRADMCTYLGARCCGMVIVPYSAFLLLPGASERRACLATIAANLEAGGLAVIDVSPSFGRHEEGPRRKVLAGRCAELRAWIDYYEAVDQDRAAGRTTFRREYEIRPDAGEPYTFACGDSWWSVGVDEMRALARDAGLEVADVLGTYEGDPLYGPGDEGEPRGYKHIHLLRHSPASPAGPPAMDPAASLPPNLGP
jgi:SAM-dependent methyltransferase